MMRSIFLTLIFGFAVVVPLAAGPFESAAHAQSKPEENPDLIKARQAFKGRIDRILKSCDIVRFRKLRAEVDTAYRQLEKDGDAYASDNTYANERLKKFAERRRGEIQLAQFEVASYLSRLHDCDPHSLSETVIDAIGGCKSTGANRTLARLQRVVQLYKRQYDRAADVERLGLGGDGKNPDQLTAKKAQIEYNHARNALYRAQLHRASCESKAHKGDIATGGETVELADVSSGPADPLGNDPCERVDGELLDEAYERDCTAWASILGTWHNREMGGTIEFRLREDRTISAYVGNANERMRYYGYVNGMEILNGWKFGGANGVTWSVWAKDGFQFSAKMPGREPGQTFGEAAWNRGGTIYIDKKNPNAIGLPGQLKWRLSNGKAWVRSQ
ncbi:hypothetical protein [Altererythrobacter sp. ZODW24]|uniref:hypothetical protein n=1 Tax=Altererythrobacter sp. ZODW24 TaxID=2185142 RepID=UPI000DF804D0|nr:hypothetical protein [Altererythrobacter sp. ZODW24]